MIENQSDNFDNKENDVSTQDNVPEDTSSSDDKTIGNDELSSQKAEDINTEELMAEKHHSSRIIISLNSFGQ